MVEIQAIGRGAAMLVEQLVWGARRHLFEYKGEHGLVGGMHFGFLFFFLVSRKARQVRKAFFFVHLDGSFCMIYEVR